MVIIMLSLSLHENKPRGDADFPAEYYYVDVSHPRFFMPFHWHQEWEMIYIRSGCATFIIDEQEYSAHCGDVLLVAEGLLHGGTPADASCIYECMVFRLSGLFSGSGSAAKCLISFLHLDNIPFLYYPQATYPVISQLAAEAMNACRQTKASGDADADIHSQRLITVGCLSQIFGVLLRDKLYVQSSGKGPSYHVTQIKSVLEYIERSYGSPVTLESMAAVAGVSPKYFCELFRQITQKTPMEYVLFYRIEQACVLLTSTNLPITEISLRCGFNDSGYFARRFKIQTGVSPSRYRKQT